MQSQLVLLIPVGSADLPGFGGGLPPGHVSGQPIYPGGHPSQGLPGGGHVSGGPVYPPGHPSAGLPVVPPNVIWPPNPPPQGVTKPVPPNLDVSHPIVVPPGTALPPDSAFVAVYTEKGGWTFAVVKAPVSGTPK